MNETPARRSSFAGDVLKLASGATIAQIIGIVASPLLTRLYAPDAFGTLAIFTSITSILGVMACLRYELAIMLPETDEEAANLLAVSLLAVMAITALSVPIVTLGRPVLLRLLNAPQLGPYLWVVPVMVFFGGVFHALNYWNTRTKQFGRLSVARVISSASTQATKLGAGYAGHATGGMLIGATVLGSLLSTGILARRIWRDDGSLFWRSIRLPWMWGGLVRYRKFPLIDVWSALLNTLSWQLPALLLNYLFSATVVGYYSLGLRVLQLPMSLVGSAIGQVFFGRAAEAKAQGMLGQVVSSTFQRLATIGLFPVLALAITGRNVFAAVFGAQWAQAGVYVQILSLWFFCGFISSPISSVVAVSGKLSFGLLMTVLGLSTRVASLFLGSVFNSPEIGLIALSISGCLVYVGLIWKVLKIACVPLHEALSVLWKVLAAFIPACFLLITIQACRFPPWVTTLATGLSLAVYYWRLALRDPEVGRIVAQARSRLRIHG